MTLFCSHAEFIAHLEGEITWLRVQMLKERQRAERAIDELLRQRVGAPPVSVPLVHDTPAEDPIEALMRDREFTEVGQ